MASLARKLLVALISCGVVVVENPCTTAWSVADDPKSAPGVLEAKGIHKYKQQFLLIDEQEVFGKCQETLDAYATARQAIQEVNAVDARSQAIIALNQRVAADRAAVENMKVFMRDGKTIALRDQFRAAELDRNNSDANRRILRAAKPTPKQVKKMATQAQDAWQAAEGDKGELIGLVREVAARYSTLWRDAQVHEALGGARFGPSEQFLRLAAELKVPAPRLDRSEAGTAKYDGLPANLVEARAELRQAADQLRAIPFEKSAKFYEKRDQRRNQTTKLIQDAVEKLDRQLVDVELVETAISIHQGYDMKLLRANAHTAVTGITARLNKALALMKSSK